MFTDCTLKASCIKFFQDENAIRIRAAASDPPPSYSTLHLECEGEPPQYNQVRRNSSLIDISTEARKRRLFEQQLKLFKSLDLY